MSAKYVTCRLCSYNCGTHVWKIQWGIVLHVIHRLQTLPRYSIVVKYNNILGELLKCAALVSISLTSSESSEYNLTSHFHKSNKVHSCTHLALYYAATIIKFTRSHLHTYLNIIQPSSANYRYCTNHPLNPLIWWWIMCCSHMGKKDGSFSMKTNFSQN